MPIQAVASTNYVLIIPAKDDINAEIDTAYCTKDRHSATFVEPIVSPEA